MSNEMKQTEDARAVASAVVHFVNSTVANVDEFASIVTSCHRTLQQNVMRLFMVCVHKWAKAYENGNYDLRNEATCLLAHNIVKAVMDRDSLPFI